ncbi:MAG: hypothetical protein CMC08_00365 [Flavobacteriaceae bacterium]|nr:hypothetical protein [Flavobacteriaceae bacterium]
MPPYKELILFLFFMAITSSTIWTQTKQQQVLFAYSDFIPKSVAGYDFLVVEPYFFSKEDVTVLKNGNKKVYAYISVGEIDRGSWFYKDLKNYSIGKNPTWNSDIITVANTETAEALHRLINIYISEKGFEGIFLDNVDNYTVYGPTPSHTESLVAFLTEVKRIHPNLELMQNAGVEIIDKTAHLVDVLAIESIATDYNFRTNTYRLRDSEVYINRANEVDAVRAAYQIPIIAIEYADTQKLKEEVLKRLRPWPWSYFIGQIDLQGTPQFSDN